MKHCKFRAFLALSVLALPALAGCASDDGGITIKLLNCEDYIGESAFDFTYMGKDKQGNPVEKTANYAGVVAGFEKYESEMLGRPVHVIYDTYDTNETMLASLKTGKTSYDLIAASDYTVQKMMTLGMLQAITEADRERLANYDDYCSSYLLDVTRGITAKVDGKDETMYDYSVGYMWGTLGILFNPAKVANEKKLPEEEVMFDMLDWNSLWDDKYRGMMSVKDSMRDTYSVGVMKRYHDDIVNYMAASGDFDMDDPMLPLLEGKFDEAVANYNPKLTQIFNGCTPEVVAEVKDVLLQLKEKIFGFEVDSGKDDMVKGLIGINLAWSGDAVYAMDRGENEADNTIYYAVPSTGGNIWFDSWCIPKGSDAEHKAVALDFLNFISDPTVAAANMDETGYSSFIAGDTVHDLIRLWYDPRSYAMFQYDAIEGADWEDSDFIYREYQIKRDKDGNPILDDEGNVIPIVDEEGNPVPVVEDKPYEYDEAHDIRYLLGFDVDDPEALQNLADFAPEEGIVSMAGSTFAKAVMDGVEVAWEDYPDVYNAKVAKFNDLVEQYNATVSEEEAIEPAEEAEGWDIRDLTYMFQGTLDGVTPEKEQSDDPAVNPYLFYTDELVEATVGEGEQAQSVLVGRQFYAQYPDNNMIPKLAVMADYGENNIHVLKMWSDVKSNNLPLAGVIVFAVVLAAAAVIVVGALLTRRYYHKFRIERRKALAAEEKARKKAKVE